VNGLRLRTTFNFGALFLSIALLRCASTPPPAPASPSRPEDRYLIDPRTGYGRPAPEAVQRKFDEAWRSLLAGDIPAAQRLLSRIDPSYPPVLLGQAAIQMHDGNLDQAAALIERARLLGAEYPALDVYRGEIALARQQAREALELYRRAASLTQLPAASSERIAWLQKQLFDALYAQALAASDEQAVAILREALVMSPDAAAARQLLVQKELALKQYEEARRDLDPLLTTQAAQEQPEVQEALAEIDAGQGRFHDAIARYERLTRRTQDPRFAERLEQLKQQWNEANMPSVYMNAVESPAITRGDLAVLMYWQIPSIRFAQNLAAPPIAIDIDVPGREEIIRALALGIYQVDPVTRRIDPDRVVTEDALRRIMARTLLVRGATCARQASRDPSDSGRAQNVLSACGLTVGSSDATVSGRDAQALLDKVDRLLASAEK
jgi:tetratricopeptide (TPR) repeat protein